MKAELLTIGEELLIGQVVNTNASWMAQRLNEVGVGVRQISSVSDDALEIMRALRQAGERADVVLITGGLGPTRDDITKAVLCEFFHTTLRLDPDVLEDLRVFFERRGVSLTALNQDQALVPAACTVIRNPLGTAPGLAFRKDGVLYVAMPGVPFEMQHLMQAWVLPELKKCNGDEVIVHRTVLTQGIGESFLADKIVHWEDTLPAYIRLAYLPSPGMVRLRLSARGQDATLLQDELSRWIERLEKLIPQYIWGYEEDRLEAVVGRLLQASGRWVATAESCTGGFVAHRLTTVAGSSAYFKGSVVAYDNQVKEQILGVPSSLLASHGAVSQAVVELMAQSVAHQLGADYGLATSGIMGPGGGSADKPLGTVWIAVSGPSGVVSRKYQMGDERERNILRTSVAALAMLRQQILENQS